MSKDKNNIGDNHDFMNRINRLLDNDKELPSDDDLTRRFKKVFEAEPIVNEKQKPDYSLPSNVHDEEVDQYLLEAQLLQSVNSDEDNDDDYLADILNSHPTEKATAPTALVQQRYHDKALKAWQDAFTGHGETDVTLDDEGHELLQQLKDQAAVEGKYASFEQHRDDELERRYLALKTDSDWITSSQTGNQVPTSSPSSVPRGSVPKPLELAELHDETDDWCCVCNEDAVIECEDCDGDRFCRQCFYDGHQSDMADYGFTKHRAKKYTK